MRGQTIGSIHSNSNQNRLLQNAVGTCPVVDLKICGVSVSCLLDTGSQVSSISEHFFKEHLAGEAEDMLSTSGWLKITAGNGLDIPHLGYLELPVETMGIALSECGFLVVRDTQSSSAVPALIGMNIIGICRQLVHAEFDTTLGGELQSDWREVFQQVQSASRLEKRSVARVAGKETYACTYATDKAYTCFISCHGMGQGNKVYLTGGCFKLVVGAWKFTFT